MLLQRLPRASALLGSLGLLGLFLIGPSVTGCGEDRSPCAPFRGKGDLEVRVMGPDGTCFTDNTRIYEVNTCRWEQWFESEACNPFPEMGYADAITGECIILRWSCMMDRVLDDPVIRPCEEVDERCCDPDVIFGECTAWE